MKDKLKEDIKRILEYYPPLIPMQDGRKTTMDYRLSAIKKYINENYTPKTARSGESSSQMSDDYDPSSNMTLFERVASLPKEAFEPMQDKQNTEQLEEIEEILRELPFSLPVEDAYIRGMAKRIVATTLPIDEIKREADGKTWYFEGDELVIKKGKWVIDRYKRQDADTILCGNAGENVYLTFKGGCREELDLKDSYRCTGCGGRFHKECILKHFELERKHDYGANKMVREFARSLFIYDEVEQSYDINPKATNFYAMQELVESYLTQSKEGGTE